MNRDGRFTLMMGCRLACAMCMLAAFVSQSPADLVNKYTFNDNTANDSIGGQHGTVVDNTGLSMYVGGAIDLTGNTGQGSAQDFSLPGTAGAYVDLPNGVFTSAIDTGNFGEASLEIWLTTQQNRGWAEAFAFGTSAGGEDVSDGNGSYVALIPQSGTTPAELRATTRNAGTATEAWVNMDTPLAPLPEGSQQHLVYVLNHLDTNGGAFPNGTGRLYLNGADVGASEIQGFLDSASLNDVNNWLGRSQWGDPLYDGTIDEFRIYNHALSAAEALSSFNTGPDAAALPVMVINRDTGSVSIANESAGNIQIKGYSIMSEAGALDPSMWTSIDADNTFDPNGTWTSQSSTSTELAESVTGGTLDGGALNASGSRSVGSPWVQTPFEDIVFEFTLGDNTTGFGQVQYEGTAVARSDLNGDGDINVTDWSQFLPNAFSSFPGDTAVTAYRKGDLDGDLDNDYDDFLLFKTDYIQANGAGAFAALGGVVPEPSSMLLGLLATGLCLGNLRRRA